ncbi:stage IV sporulation protein FA [Natronobacillus azotifigens]|uniref:M23 family metallopeptidase n=1 Tax=Natronobacillus azotifigens TaxID=472978 RepID=A0A9J6R9N7_9BACI|nr:M23 family metallopeptidase [Natronobacillus azotifigens]MCZ0702394.1 M23 family metallopeptidase [Natronobacillus azotifigens]
MKRDIEQIRRDIAKRKQQRGIKSTKQSNYIGSDFVQDEERHGYISPSSFSSKSIEKSSSENVKVPSFILKSILAGVLFFSVAITMQWDANWLTKPKEWTTTALTEDFPFATVNLWYQEQFGAPFGFLSSPADVANMDERSVPVNGVISQPFHANGKGVWIATEDQSDVYAVEQGTVLFAGNDRETNKTVIIQHPDRSKTIYGNLSEINVNPYQFVQANQVIATFEPTEDNYGGVYFAIQKKNEYIDPVQVIQVDESS